MALNFHEELKKAEVVRGSSDRTFGLIFAAFSAFYGVNPVRHHQAVRWPAFLVASIFLLVALLRPRLLRPVNKAWTKLGLLMSKVMNPVVTGILFYVVFTPVAVALRLMGKDPLRLKLAAGAETYWERRVPPGPAPESMPAQF